VSRAKAGNIQPSKLQVARTAAQDAIHSRARRHASYVLLERTVMLDPHPVNIATTEHLGRVLELQIVLNASQGDIP
jgi:hypothetical protein